MELSPIASTGRFVAWRRDQALTTQTIEHSHGRVEWSMIHRTCSEDMKLGFQTCIG